MRILVVDDDRDFTESIGELIELEGHQPVLAYNGVEALKIFKQNNIDIILLDFRMPGLNGIETLSEIRKLNLSVPVVIMTAYASTELTKDAIKHGAIEVMNKPFNINKLMEIISSIKQFHNILLLDDDKDYADSLSIALLDEGYKTYVAYDTEQAINYISDNDIQLQILDIRINGETGIDVWLSMRKKHFDIPTIFITGYTKQFFDQINEISQISQIEIMEKPFAPHELINKIENFALARF
ncbi:MAG: response regulator [Gammaproteobacteria bacterium]